jgi:hypothetical protein
MTTTTRKLPEHFMVSETDGGLYDTRNPGWHKLAPLRAEYQGNRTEIKTTAQLKASLRNPYAWPGGYEIVYFTSDGALLCADCVRKHLRSVLDSIKTHSRDGWRVVGCGYEAVSAEHAAECDPDLVSYCAHCNQAFGEIC